jgi:hypothetical protein
VAIIPACHAGNPGSIPGRGVFFFTTNKVNYCYYELMESLYSISKIGLRITQISLYFNRRTDCFRSLRRPRG